MRFILAIVAIVLTFTLVSGCMGATVVDRRSTGQNSPSYAPTIDSSAASMQSALSDYESKVSIVNIEQNSLQSYANTGSTFVTADEYKTWIDGYKQRLDSYKSKCYDQIEAGQRYKTYLSSGTSEYNRVVTNEATINNNLARYSDEYNRLMADYNKYKATSNAANNYINKLNAVTAAQKDMQNYANAAGSFSSLSEEWVDGYGQKVDAYTNACDQAVYAGRDLQQHYAFGSTEYTKISEVETALLKNENNARTSYNELKASSDDWQSFVSIVKLIPEVAPFFL
jgi:hypothetical protein